MNVYFHNVEIGSRIKRKKEIGSWIVRVLNIEGKKTGEINIIEIANKKIIKLNKDYLNRSYKTDIIAFNFNEGDIISGDLYIAPDVVKENANRFNTVFNNEMKRVVIHGVLHLVGYDDRDVKEVKEMRRKEDLYLALYNKMNTK